MIVHLYSAFNLFWILCNSALINFLQFCLYCLVRPFDQVLYRRMMAKYAQSLWVDVMSSCFPETTMVASGDLPMDTKRPCIILANHQVDADWWYLWQAARAFNGAGNIKIVLKEPLKYVPILGWGMRLFEFLFLKRSIEHDASHIRKYMAMLHEEKFPFWMIIFPEGTTIHTEYVEKSTQFALKNKRPTLKRLLLPRTTGLQLMLDAVKDSQPDIYDLTIGLPSYSGEIPTFGMGYDRKIDTDIPSMKSLLAGKKPGTIHLHGKKYTYHQVMNDFSSLENFLDTCWLEKEKQLDYFIQHQQFEHMMSTKLIRTHPTRPSRTKSDQKQIQEEIVLPSSIVAVFRLWFGITMSFFLLPFVMFSFFPTYTLWVIYCFWYSIYDRTTNFWWPYISNLLLEHAEKTRQNILQTTTNLKERVQAQESKKNNK